MLEKFIKNWLVIMNYWNKEMGPCAHLSISLLSASVIKNCKAAYQIKKPVGHLRIIKLGQDEVW